jgi:hypothetical protein
MGCDIGLNELGSVEIGPVLDQNLDLRVRSLALNPLALNPLALNPVHGPSDEPLRARVEGAPCQCSRFLADATMVLEHTTAERPALSTTVLAAQRAAGATKSPIQVGPAVNSTRLPPGSGRRLPGPSRCPGRGPNDCRLIVALQPAEQTRRDKRQGTVRQRAALAGKTSPCR